MTTGVVLHPATSDVKVMPGDVERVCGIQTRLQLLEEVCEVWEDGLQMEASWHRLLAARIEGDLCC